MQPIQKFKKTLLAGALILGTCNAFNASADNFPVVAEAVPDVTAGFVTGYTEVSFGTGVIGNKSGFFCQMAGKTGIAENIIMLDLDDDGADDPAASFGALSGAACVAGGSGTPMVIEIDGADASTVSVTVADVVTSNFTYTPTAESCVVKFSGNATAAADTCASLAGNSVTGIPMSKTQTDDALGSTEIEVGTYGYSAIIGKTRMVLAGRITLTDTIAAGSSIAENIIVQVTYE